MVKFFARWRKKKDYVLRTKPLSHDEIRQFENLWVEGVIPIDLDVFSDNTLEGVLDIMSDRLVGDELLMDISYEVVGHRQNELHLRVSGNAQMCLESEDDQSEGSGRQFERGD